MIAPSSGSPVINKTGVFTRFAYYIRKNPTFIHEIMDEYTKVNIEVLKRLAEVGVDIVMFGDDLGYKENPFFSLDVWVMPQHTPLAASRHVYTLSARCSLFCRSFRSMRRLALATPTSLLVGERA